MPFFQDAKDFEINGGNFYEVAGDQTNHRHDNSVTFGGTGNTTAYSPNLSRQDNRTYNLGYSNTSINGYHSGTHNYAGFPQNNAFPQLSFQEFLAWQQQQQQQGLSRPTSFQSHAIGGPTSPGQQTNGFYSTREPQPVQAPSQYSAGDPPYLPRQPMQSPLHGTPPQFAPGASPYHPLPLPPPVWGNVASSGHQHQHPLPPQQHHRSHIQPLPSVISEQSGILSEADGANFPGFGALQNLDERIRKQAQASENASPRPQSTPATNSQRSPSPINEPSSASLRVSHQQTATVPTATQMTSTRPPPPNIATKPQKPHHPPSIPVLTTVPTSTQTTLPLQTIHTPTKPFSNHSRRHSSSNSSATSSSDSEHRKYQQATAMPGPSTNGPRSASPDAPSVPNPGPSPPPTSMPVPNSVSQSSTPQLNVATPPPRHEATSSYAAFPQEVTAPPVTPSFNTRLGQADPDDMFSKLKPLNNGISLSTSTPPKKKKGFLAKIGLKKTKEKA